MPKVDKNTKIVLKEKDGQNLDERKKEILITIIKFSPKKIKINKFKATCSV